MQRFYCNGKKGYCERGNDGKALCNGCEHFNEGGGIIVDDDSGLFKNIKSDVVKEIFTDLEKWLADYDDLKIITADKFFELKEKYTGEVQNGRTEEEKETQQ